MTIMTIEQQIKLIVQQQLPGEEISDATRIPPEHMSLINDDVCMALNINISTPDAGRCRTVGEYVALVRSHRGKADE